MPHLDFWRRWWHPTPVLLPGKSHGRRSLGGCSPWGCEESDMTEWLHFHFSLACIGEGNGNPLQCSCLENSRDGGALWAAICGVAQSRTQLKRLSSSSSSPTSRRRWWHPTPVLLPGKSHGRRSLGGCSPWGREESDTTERLNWTDVLIWGEGNGNPLQYPCLENPMDGGAWEAAVHGVAKSQARLSDFPFTFHFHALEKEMAAHSSVLAWRIPGTGEPGGLLSMGSHGVRHDWSDLAAACTYCTSQRK